MDEGSHLYCLGGPHRVFFHLLDGSLFLADGVCFQSLAVLSAIPRLALLAFQLFPLTQSQMT